MSKFFEKQTTASRLKTQIVLKYFAAWSYVFKDKNCGLGYYDLFCGPGIYEDGTPSTPIRMLMYAIKQPHLRDRLLTLFVDKDKDSIDTLRREVNKIDGIGTLAHDPVIEVDEVGQHTIEHFRDWGNTGPLLMFLDPWGYKEISRDFLTTVTKGLGL